jgi:GTP-sensing pleiotropic transcriptional regulator CodY
MQNEINDAEAEKNVYQNILNNEYRTHSSELEESYAIINEKNNIILYMEETIDKYRKEFRVLSDDYVLLKNKSIDEKEFF